MGKHVLAVGDVNMDIVLTGLKCMPAAEQETLAQGLDILVGGQAATVARAMAKLSMDVAFVGRIGDDEYGRRAVAELSAAGVDVSAVIVDPRLRTGVTVVLSTGAERAYATFAGSASAVRRSDITREILSRTDHLHAGSYYLQDGLRPEMKGLFQDAKELGLTTSLDPGFDPLSQWGGDILEVLPLVDVFLPNEAEAEAIAGAASARKALHALAELSGTVVIKMGGRGCIGASGKKALGCHAFPATVVDVTSAGDVFDAGFLYGFLHGWSMTDSMRFACACGAVAVSRIGSDGVISGAQQVHGLLAADANAGTVYELDAEEHTGGRE